MLGGIEGKGLARSRGKPIHIQPQFDAFMSCELVQHTGDLARDPRAHQDDVDARGQVFLEVPFAADVLTLQHPEGVGVRWLPRDGAPRGEALQAAVLEHLGTRPEPVVVADEEVDPDLWETPAYSSSGEDVDVHERHVGHDFDGLYAWIAGEAKVVTGLRRALVKDLGIDRHQVAFMGYWRVGVAMKS